MTSETSIRNDKYSNTMLGCLLLKTNSNADDVTYNEKRFHSRTQQSSKIIRVKESGPCLIVCSEILLNVLHNISLIVLLPWRHIRFQNSPILNALLAPFVIYSILVYCESVNLIGYIIVCYLLIVNSYTSVHGIARLFEPDVITFCILLLHFAIKVIPLKLFYYQTFFETWRNEHS